MSEITFTTKTQANKYLNQEFQTWDQLLHHLTAHQATTTIIYNNRTIKDDIAHLWEW